MSMHVAIAILAGLFVSPLTLSTLPAQSTRSSAAAQYAARSKGDVVELEDTKHRTVVTIVPLLVSVRIGDGPPGSMPCV